MGKKPSEPGELASCLGCLAIPVLLIVLEFCVISLYGAPHHDSTPAWWKDTTVFQLNPQAQPLRTELMRMLLFSVCCIPFYWAAVEYAKESKAGFPTRVTSESFLWMNWQTTHTWHERYWPAVGMKISVTYIASLIASGLLWCLIAAISFVLTGVVHLVDYSCILFILTALIIAVLISNVAGPVRHLTRSESLGHRLWGYVIIAFETCGIILTARDIIHHLN